MISKILNKFSHKLKSLPLMALGAVTLSGLAVVSCSLITYASSEKFTIQGMVDANTALEFSPLYKAIDKDNPACYEPELIFGIRSEIREDGRMISVAAKPEKHAYQVKIPRYIMVKSCKTEIIRVRVKTIYHIDHQQNDDYVSISGLALLNPSNDLIGEVNCTSYFKIIALLSKPDTNIANLLHCKLRPVPNKNNTPTNLKEPPFLLNIKILNDAIPYREEAWIKVKNGWKPCENKDNPDTDGACENPPKFRTFKHNGKTCTVYPSCTE